MQTKKGNEGERRETRLLDLPDGIMGKILARTRALNVARFKTTSRNGARVSKNVNIRAMRVADLAKSVEMIKGMPPGEYKFYPLRLKREPIHFLIGGPSSSMLASVKFTRGGRKPQQQQLYGGYRGIAEWAEESGVPSDLSLDRIEAMEALQRVAKTFVRAYMTQTPPYQKTISETIETAVQDAYAAGISSNTNIMYFMIAEILKEAMNLVRAGEATSEFTPPRSY